MRTITVALGAKTYDIEIAAGLLAASALRGAALAWGVRLAALSAWACSRGLWNTALTMGGSWW